MKITSLNNPTVKSIVKLSKHKERVANNIFVIEGARELSLAVASGYCVQSVFVCYDLFAKTKYPSIVDEFSPEIVTEITPEVFAKIAYRDSSDGIVALVTPMSHTLDNLNISDNPFIIVLESVEKPGNLGAIMRCADAAGADAIIVCDPLTDLYNPNVIRSSVGALFTTQTAVCTSQEAITWLSLKGITTYAAELQASANYQDVDFSKPSAIVMGTEADGLSSFWLDRADKRIIIPMRGKIDSLNVSVATAVITFEAMRQRL